MFPKEFIIEDGQIYYRKKPLHKQPLFWTTIVGGVVSLVLLIVTFFLLIALGATNVYDGLGEGISDNYTYDEYIDWSDYEEYSIGESAEVDDLQLTTTSMEIEDSDDDWYAKLVVAKVEIENTGKDAYYFDEYLFSLYGDNEYGLIDDRTYDVDIPEKINPGKKVTLTLYYNADYASTYRLVFMDEVYWSAYNTGSI